MEQHHLDCACSHGKETVKIEHDGCGCGHEHGKKTGTREIVQLITGGFIFGVGIVMEWGFERFEISPYITFSIFMAAYIILGWEVVLNALKNIVRGKVFGIGVFDENFLMSVATVGAFAIGEYPEAAAVMLFYQVGEYFQGMAVRKSKKSIAELMDIRPDYANIIKDGDCSNSDTVRVLPETVQIGDVIVVKPGEKIPLDGVVLEGESMLDTTALTGESVPKNAKPSDTVLSGCINKNGVLKIKVTKTFGESTVAKIIDLVENASQKKATTEKFITKFARYYTPIVVIMATLLAVISPLFFGGIWSEWINRGLIFLVISCPCALVISIPLGFFGGIGGASRKGILVKGGNYLEALNNLDIVVFDKTGTLTKGVFEVTAIEYADGFTQDELLEAAARAESFSSHPIALSVLSAYNNSKQPVSVGVGCDKVTLTDYNEIAGHGVSVNSNGRTILAGNHKLMESAGITYIQSRKNGTKVYVAIDNTFAGCITISDEIKPDSHNAIALLKRKGVRKTVMLTGDNKQIAHVIAEDLGIDQVYSELLPNEKVEIAEKLQSEGKLAFVGDGINDAPVLARADVGIAMGGLGSDAAIEAADVVIMTDEPSKLAKAIDIARFTKKIVWQNIIFSLGVKAVFLVLGAFGVATMWEAVFADVGVALLAVLNATRAMRVK